MMSEPPSGRQRVYRLQTLGGVDARDPDGGEVRALLTQPKRLTLLVYLALAPTGYRRRDSISALFWPEADTEHSRAALRQALQFLRQTLGPDVLVARGAEEVGVDPTRLECDAVVIDKLARTRNWADVMERYCGEFLEGVYARGSAAELDEWVAAERRRLRDLAARASWGLAEDARAIEDAAGALRWGRIAARLDDDADLGAERLRELKLAALGEASRLPDPPGPKPPAGPHAGNDQRTHVSRHRRALVSALVVLSVAVGAWAGAAALGSTGAVSARRPPDTEAHLLLLRGLHAVGERTPEGFRRARDLFLRAIERDPVYADAYVELANAYQGMAHYGAMAGREAFPRARGAALRALEIDSTLGRAHTALAAVLTFHDRDFPAAEREFRVALRLDPDDPVTHNFYGIHLRILRRFDEAAREMETASRLDPLARVYVRQRGLVAFCAGRYREALAQFRSALDMEPAGRDAQAMTVETLAQLGEFDAALEQWRRDSVSALPDSLRQALRDARGPEGYHRTVQLKASLDLQALPPRAARVHVAASEFARTYARLEQWDSAFVWLDRAVDERDPDVLKLECDPAYTPVRSTPRFVHLLNRLGLS